MKQAEQVVGLEIALQIEKAGGEQDSKWFWVLGEENKFGHQDDEYGNKWWLWYRPQDYFGVRKSLNVSAYTVAELGEKLPVGYKSYRDGFEDDLSRYKCGGEDVTEQLTYALTEADARAKKWLYLKDKGSL